MNTFTSRSLCMIFLLFFLLLTTCTTSNRFDSAKRDQSFNAEWKFVLDSMASGQEQPAFDDSQWQNIDLPHDWSMMGIRDTGHIGPFSKKSPGTTSTGYVLGRYRMVQETFYPR